MSNSVKKPFVLLEVFIAIALMGLLVLPFLRYPYRDLQREMEDLYLMQLQRRADEKLVESLEQFYQREVPKDFFEGKRTNRESYSSVCTIALPGLGKKYYKEKVEWLLEKRKESLDGVQTLVKLRITYWKKNTIILEAATRVIARN